MRTKIQISEIKVPDRIRKKVSDIENLAESIRHLGLLQPIGVTDDKLLVWGFRRLQACKHLGMTEVDTVSARDVPEDEREEMEYAENVERSDFTWQEKALGLLRIWRKKRLRGAAEGWKWGANEASREFGMSVGTVQYILIVAKRLELEQSLPEDKRKYWHFQNASEAYRLGILDEEMQRVNADLAKRAKEKSETVEQAEAQRVEVQRVEAVQASPDLLAAERARYLENPLNIEPFEKYWAERVKIIEESKRTIHLANRVLHVNCLDLMMDPEHAGSYDHIITDPPYAIDMENLDQQNQHGGMSDIDKVIERHQVEENMSLLAKFFPAAWRCTKDKAFVVVCCDVMLWQFLYDQAIGAGFAVQRWPLIWRKVNQAVMNNCAGYNSTKDYEVIMVCRKPGATLMQKRNSSIIDGSNVEVKKAFAHPFSKPFELTKALVEMVSIPDQLILEPFAGAGSIAVGILQCNRRVVACEREDVWYDALLTNIKTQYYLKINPKFVFK